MSKKLVLNHDSLKNMVCESFDAALVAAIPRNKTNKKHSLNESQLRQYVRYILKEMDYDQWKTQTPEEYFGWRDDSYAKRSTWICLSELVYDVCIELGWDEEKAEEASEGFEFDGEIIVDGSGNFYKGDEIFAEVDNINNEQLRKAVEDAVNEKIDDADYIEDDDYEEDRYDEWRERNM